MLCSYTAKTRVIACSVTLKPHPHLLMIHFCLIVDPHSLNGESFEWLTKEQTYVLVYLVSPVSVYFSILLSISQYIALSQFTSVNFCLISVYFSISQYIPQYIPAHFNIFQYIPVNSPVYLCTLQYISVYPPLQVCIMHSVQAGSIDKALNYTSKAIELIQRNQGNREGGESPVPITLSPLIDGNPVMTVFQGHLLENIVVCLLMQGKSKLAGSTVRILVN